jgi:Leucine Rich repeat/Leucine rich repeat
MNHSHLKSFPRLLSGFAVTTFLSFLAEPLPVYAGSDDPEQAKFKARPSGEPLPAGENSGNLEKKASGLSSLAALWLKRGNDLFEEMNYPEALEFYKMAAKQGNEEAVTQLFLKGEEFYTKKKIKQAMDWYAEAFAYGREEAKEKIAAFGLEAGNSYVAKGQRCYEQAAFLGNKEAKEKLKQLKLPEAKKQRRLKATEEQKQETAAAAKPAPLSLVQQGDVFLKDGNLTEALKAYSEAVLKGNAAAQGKLKSTAEWMLQELSAEGKNPYAKVFALFDPEGREQTELNLRFSKVDAAGTASLASILSQTKVTTLDLSGNLIGNAGAEILSKNTTLTMLSLGSNQIGDAGAQALSKNTTLTTLNLEWNQIGDAGAQALPKNTTLTTLDLSGNEIGDAGAKALLKALSKMSLKSLDLSRNCLSDAVKKELKSKTYHNAKGELVKVEWGYPVFPPHFLLRRGWMRGGVEEST